MNAIKYLPYILLFIGLIIFFDIPAYFGIVVWYDDTPPVIETTYPAGKSSSSPTLLMKNMQYRVSLVVKEPDSPISTVAVDLYKGTSSSSLSLVTGWTIGDFDSEYLGNGRWRFTCKNSFTAEKGYYYKIVVVVENRVGLWSKVERWGFAGEPTGKFYLNGKEATPSAVIYLTNPTINYKFVATQLGSYITRVYVVISKGSQSTTVDLDETEKDKTWTKKHTLPFGRGKYIITGKITIPGGTSGSPEDLLQMSVVVPYGEEEVEDFLSLGLPKYQLYGLAFIAAGLIVWLATRKKQVQQW